MVEGSLAQLTTDTAAEPRMHWIGTVTIDLHEVLKTYCKVSTEMFTDCAVI